jgi:hypothetical protein
MKRLYIFKQLKSEVDGQYFYFARMKKYINGRS